MSVVQITAGSDWMYAIDTRGCVWERPLPVTGLDDKWELLPALPGEHRAASMIVTVDNAVHVVTDRGGVFKYMTDKWEDETPPFKELPQ
jgi:hypothetical protein